MISSLLERLLQAWRAAEPAHTIPATLPTSMFSTCRYRTQQIERLVSQQSALLKKLVHAHSQAWKRHLMWRLILRVGGLLMWGLDPRNLFRLLYRHTITAIVLFFAYSFGRSGLKALLKVWRRMWEFFACRILRSEYHLGRRLLYRQMKDATSYVAWEKAARKLDKLEGKHKWREEAASEIYNFERIDRNIHILRQLLAHGDSEDLMYYLRSRLNRNLGNIAANELYTKLRVGTKRLIEDYNVEVQRALEMICADPSIAHTQKLAFIKETRHSYGRTALLLSGGGTMGLYHLGVIKALHENNLLPQVISGSSAGSIFAALVATRTDQQIAQMGDANTLELSFFPNHGSTWKSLSAKFRRFLTEGVPLDIEVLAKCVRANVGDVTFQEAYDKYGRIINITVTPTNQQNQPLLLNFLTSPNVLLWSAAVASCAIPGIYQPVQLMAKNKHGEIVPYYVENVLFMDGSVALDLPLERLRELFNVNHFIVSQVNPHVVPFLFRATSFKDASPLQRLIRYLAAETNHLWSNLWDLTGVTAQRLSGISGIVAFLNSLTTQQYQGDITLVPRLHARDYGLVLVNPTVERMVYCCGKSRAYTWTRMNVINGHCELEFALDRCVRRLRGEIIYEAETRKTKRVHNMRRTFARQYRPASSMNNSTANGMGITNASITSGGGTSSSTSTLYRPSFASRSPRAPARIITAKQPRPDSSPPPPRSSSHSSSMGLAGTSSNDSITHSAVSTNAAASNSRSRPVALAAAYLDNNHVNHHAPTNGVAHNNNNNRSTTVSSNNMSRKVVSMLDMRHYGNASDEVGAPELEDEIYTRGGSSQGHHHRTTSDAYADEDDEHKYPQYQSQQQQWQRQAASPRPVAFQPSRSAVVSPVRITGTSTKAHPIGGLGGRSSSMVALSSLDKDPLLSKYADLDSSLPGSPEMRPWQSAPSAYGQNGSGPHHDDHTDEWRLDHHHDDQNGDAGSQQHYCDVFHVPGQRCNECGQLEDDIGSSSAGGANGHHRAQRSSSDDDDDAPPSPVHEDMIGADASDIMMMNNNRSISKDSTPDSTPAITAVAAATAAASSSSSAIIPSSSAAAAATTATRRRSPARSPTLSSVPRTIANASIRTPPQQSPSGQSSSSSSTITNGHHSTPMSDRIRSWSALDFANQGKWASNSSASSSTTLSDASITKAILLHNPSPTSSSSYYSSTVRRV